MDELVGYSVKTFSPGSIGDSLKIGKHKFLILLIIQNIKYTRLCPVRLTSSRTICLKKREFTSSTIFFAAITFSRTIFQKNCPTGHNLVYDILNTPMTVRFFDLTAYFTLSDSRPVMTKQTNFWSRICFIFQFL